VLCPCLQKIEKQIRCISVLRTPKFVESKNKKMAPSLPHSTMSTVLKLQPVNSKARIKVREFCIAWIMVSLLLVASFGNYCERMTKLAMDGSPQVPKFCRSSSRRPTTGSKSTSATSAATAPLSLQGSPTPHSRRTRNRRISQLRRSTQTQVAREDLPPETEEALSDNNVTDRGPDTDDEEEKKKIRSARSTRRRRSPSSNTNLRFKVDAGNKIIGYHEV
jgi:hypothetical protein